MNQRIDGGPAFPHMAKPRPDLGKDIFETFTNGGMSLRDYFAANAPPPPGWWMDGYAKTASDLQTVAETIAQWEYVYADVMLKARQS